MRGAIDLRQLLQLRPKQLEPASRVEGRPLYLSNETRKRGGKKSRRRTARVWKPID